MLTLDQVASQAGYNGLEKGAIKMFTQVSPVMEMIPWVSIEGDSITWRREASLPGFVWRPVGGTYTASEGRIDAFTERLMIAGGEVTADNFTIATQGKGDNGIDIKASHYALKAQAIANGFDQAFFEGDALTDPNTMVGLRSRLTLGQVLAFGAGGTTGSTLTLAQLDQLRDAVPFANACFFSNRTLRRKVSALIQAQTGAYRIETTQDSFGRQIMMYADTPWYVVERTGDGSTMLDFDEDDGGGTTSNTASIYCVAFGPDKVHGIYNTTLGGKMIEVTDFGEIQAAPRHLGRIEFYPGMAIKHPRAAARIRAVTNT